VLLVMVRSDYELSMLLGMMVLLKYLKLLRLSIVTVSGLVLLSVVVHVRESLWFYVWWFGALVSALICASVVSCIVCICICSSRVFMCASMRMVSMIILLLISV